MFSGAVSLRSGLSLVLVGCVQAALSAQAVQQVNPAAAPSNPPTTQAPSTSPLTDTPGAIYKQAMHPLDVVRSSMDNWSDAEVGALVVGMHKAADACRKVTAQDYSGDDLYDLARLCSLGQDWADAGSAASQYIDSHAEPHRAQAFALSMNAYVHQDMKPLAVQTALAMLRDLPYDAETAYAFRYLKDVLEQDGSPDALKLAQHEHPAIVAALQAGVPLKAIHGDAVMNVGALYESAMEEAFWGRFSGDDAAAAKIAEECNAALPNMAALSTEDRQRVEAVQTQFKLIGKHLPEIKVLRSLQSDKAKPRIDPDYGTATVVVLFPDWCAQCRAMMKNLTAFAVINSQEQIHAYGLMFAEDNPLTGQASNPALMKDVQGTAVLQVAPETATVVGAVDYPFGIIVDRAGIVRYVGVLSANTFGQSGNIDRLLKPIIGGEIHPVNSAPPKDASSAYLPQ